MDIKFYTYVDSIKDAIVQANNLGLLEMEVEMKDKNQKRAVFRLKEQLYDDFPVYHIMYLILLERDSQPIEQGRFQEFDFWAMECSYDDTTDYTKKENLLRNAFGLSEITTPCERIRFRDPDGYRTFITGPRFLQLDYGLDCEGEPRATFLDRFDVEIAAVINVKDVAESRRYYSLLDYNNEVSAGSRDSEIKTHMRHNDFKDVSIVLEKQSRDNASFFDFDKGVRFELLPKSSEDFISLRDEYVKRGFIDKSGYGKKEFLTETKFTFLGIEGIYFSILAPGLKEDSVL